MELSFDPENPNFEYIIDNSRAEEALKELKEERVIAVDVESNGLDPYTNILFLVQLSNREKAYVFDARSVSLSEIPLYKEIMEDGNVVKILQNAKFDYQFLKIHTDVEIKNIYDTMLAEEILNAGLKISSSLGAMTDRLLGEGAIDKKLQKSFGGLPKSARISQEQLAYGAVDVLVLFPIFDSQTKRLQKENLLNIAKLEFAVVPVVAEMELNGVYIDKKKWRGIIKNLEKKRNEAADKFQEAVRPYYSTSQIGLFGGMADAININSSTQLMELFNNKLNLNLPSTSSGVLSRVNDPIVRILTEYRGYEKLISTYGEKLLQKINRKTGRIHPDFLQLRTATGRFACNNPNLQNIPRNSEEAPFRECFNPEEGYKLVVSDYSSFEMRILAELSGDEKMIHALNEGLDIHSYTAALMFDKPYSDDFKKLYPELRQMAKPIGFGLMYGMGAMGLVSSVYMQTGKDITVEDGEDLIKRYFSSYPSVEKFLRDTANKAVRRGWSITPAGRKRWYTKPDKSDPDYRRKIGSIEREAKNHPIQGTNADAIKYALVFVRDRIRNENIDAKIVSTVHDEIVCEVRDDQAQDFAQLLSDEMIRAGQLFLKKVKIKSDPFVGDVWEH